MHPEAAFEKETAIFWNGRSFPQEVLEDGGARLLRMHALRHLGELERIAEQDEVVGGSTHGQGIGQGDLARLVDHEVVESAVQLCPREEPSRPRQKFDVTARSDNFRDLGLVRDETAGVFGLLVSGGRLLQTSEGYAVLTRDLLDLREQVVDCLVTLGGNADPVSVGKQMDDDAGPRPSLPCARRSLDEEV